DVEEAPVVDLFGRDLPEGEPVGLDREQVVQEVEGLRIVRPAVEVFDRSLDGASDFRAGLVKGHDPSLGHLFFAVALSYPLRLQLRARWEVADSRKDGL